MSKLPYKLSFLTLSLIGVALIPLLSVKLVPDNTGTSLSISYYWPNTSQKTIEHEVTSAYEGVLSTIEVIRNIKSKTYLGRGEIIVEIDEKTNLQEAQFTISNAIRQIYGTLPEGVSYPDITSHHTEQEETAILNYSVLSDRSDHEIETFFNQYIFPELSAKEGVNQIKLEGIKRRYLDFVFDEDKILQLGIDKSEIIDAIRLTLSTKGLGNIYQKDHVFAVQLKAHKNTEDLYNTLLKREEGKLIYLKDIVKIREKEERGRSYFRINGLATQNFYIMADKSANQIKVANQIKACVDVINKHSPDFEIKLTYDETVFLKRELTGSAKRTGVSLLVLLVITILLYRDFRKIVLLFASLLVCLLLAINLYYIFNIEIHLYSLLGLTVSLGFIIDNSIITIDHYSKHNKKGPLLAVLAASLTTIGPLLIILALEEANQSNLRDFMIIIIINLTCSFFVAIWFIPAFLKITPTSRQVKLIKTPRYEKPYQFFIEKGRKGRYFAIIILIPLLGSPHTLLPKRLASKEPFSRQYNQAMNSELYKTEIRPFLDQYLGGALKLFAESSQETSFINPPERLSLKVQMNTPFGANFEYINEVCKKIESEISPIEIIEDFHTRIFDNNNAEIKIYLKEEFEKGSAPYKIKALLVQLAINIGGVDFFVSGVGKPFSNSSGHPVGANLMIKGYDYDELTKHANTIKKNLEENPRVKNIQLRSEASWFFVPSQEFVPAFFNYSDDIPQVLSTVSNYFSSQEIGNYNLNDKITSLRLLPSRLEDRDLYELQHQVSPINDSLYFKSISRFAIAERELPSHIVKENQEYQIAIQFDVNGLTKLRNHIVDQTVETFRERLPVGFHLYEEDFRWRSPGSWKMFISLGASLILIFLICAISFESVRQSLIILLMIPFCFTGVFYLLSQMETGFDQGVYAGLILLVGLLINSAIFIIAEYNHCLKEYLPVEAYLLAFRRKIFPITVTALSTIASLAHFIIYPDHSFWYSFSITVILGLILSLVVLIFLLPIFLVKPHSHE